MSDKTDILNNPLPTGEIPEEKKIRNAVILPDGTKPVPMGSGVITGILGAGGMANVYEIWNAQLEVNRAVKLLHPNYTVDQKQRFQTEMKICANLHHPNIVEIHAVGAWNGLPYIEMERVKGSPLDRMITERGALPLEVCTAVGILITRALRHAHNQEYVLYGTAYHGVIHRDLKPSNIMISQEGAVKLMDFGIARPTDASIHTTDGAILGTMQYLSPEQLDGKEADVRTDIYSMGTILYEMLTGVQAFPEQNISKLMLSKIRNAYKPLDNYNLRIPSRFRALIHRCMVQDREKRTRNSDVLLNELTRFHRSVTLLSPEQVVEQYMGKTEVRHTVVGRRRVIPVRLILGVCAAVAAAAAGVTLYGRAQRLSADRTRAEQARPADEVARTPSPPPVEPVTAAKPPVPERVTAAPRAEPAPSAAKEHRRQSAPAPAPAPFEALTARYGTTDLQTIFCKEVEAASYASALDVYEALTAEQAQTTKVMLYRLRALDRTGRSAQLTGLLAAHFIADGEYHIIKAKYALSTGDVAGCRASIARGLTTPTAALDPSLLRTEALYLRALCDSRDFDAAPSQETVKKALDSWFEVKAAMRASADHAYYKKAVDEMQRIRIPAQK